VSDEVENGKVENNNVERDESGFDWVTRRSQCSLPKVFTALRAQVEADVKTRNALRPNNAPYEFSVTEDGAEFTAALAAQNVHRSVIFSLAAHAIVVRTGQGAPMFEVTLTFNDQGECKLQVDAKQCELWQLRRMALEELLFSSLSA
jgi:hypothetical protein